MPLSAEEYDALTPDAQRAHDAAEAERERIEQAALPYRWTQALDHVEVCVPVPEGTRAKQVRVDMSRTRLCVVVHGTTIVEVRAAWLTQGELAKPVRPDDCTWTIDDGTTLVIHLEKENQNEWWAHVVTHHPRIDTTKIRPEDSKLSDLDGETRAMVEKMMPHLTEQLAQRTP
ncbi:hypothetical protein MBRA1_001449 [Malassezia brasiliensis]|uniref:Nuclear movement protein nudC n=1 Tax=Malassezia brasiliensis TaxID=1821822 RepID=A0AAF0DRP1_9BASI|nr:hypothetical protein MBRA1_001449 [Malassezia brasiliensis]